MNSAVSFKIHFWPKLFNLNGRLMYQPLTKKFRDVDGVLKDPGCRAESILQVYNSTIYNQGMILTTSFKAETYADQIDYVNNFSKML